jgi:hypothetical protein
VNILCRENDFEEGNHFYRFLEHEPFISKCFNFRGATNDSEPKSAAAVCDRLTKIMYAILESYASEDRRHVDYVSISKSEEFRRYGLVNLIIICLYLVFYLGAFCVCKLQTFCGFIYSTCKT